MENEEKVTGSIMLASPHDRLHASSLYTYHVGFFQTTA